MQLIKDVDVPAHLLSLIDQMLQKPSVRQVCLCDHSLLHSSLIFTVVVVI